MRKIIISCAFIPLLLLPAVAAHAEKVGVVDMNYLMERAPQAEAAGQQLQQAFGPAQEEMQAKQQEFQELAEKLERDSLVMDESERQETEQRMRELQQEMQQMQQQFQQQLSQQQEQAYGQIQQLIAEVAEDIATEEGIDVVVGQGVLYASDSANLTERVLDRLEARAEE